MPSDPGEAESGYSAFKERMLALLAPQGEAEKQLAQTILDAQWRVDRLRSTESHTSREPKLRVYEKRQSRILKTNLKVLMEIQEGRHRVH